jgi:hypothetical protein
MKYLKATRNICNTIMRNTNQKKKSKHKNREKTYVFTNILKKRMILYVISSTVIAYSVEAPVTVMQCKTETLKLSK